MSDPGQFGALAAAALLYQQETGFEPQKYVAAVEANAGVQGRANALLGDLSWYRQHTESVANRVRCTLLAAIG